MFRKLDVSEICLHFPNKNNVLPFYQFSLLQHCFFEGRPFTSDIRNTWIGGFKYVLGGPNDLKKNPEMPLTLCPPLKNPIKKTTKNRQRTFSKRPKTTTQAGTQPTSLLQVDKPSTKTVGGTVPGSWKSSRDLANVTQIPPILVGASEFWKKHADRRPP